MYNKQKLIAEINSSFPWIWSKLGKDPLKFLDPHDYIVCEDDDNQKILSATILRSIKFS